MEEQLKYFQNKLAFEIDPSDLFEALNKGEKIISLDTRKSPSYQAEHIPNAIHIPYRKINEENTKHLDRNYIYITYCDGIGCNASTKGALNMTKLNFRVKELIGGITRWKFDGYATEGAKANSDGEKIQCDC